MNYKQLKLNILKAIEKHSDNYKLVSLKTNLNDSEMILAIIRRLHKYNIISSYDSNYSVYWKIEENIADNLPRILIEICENEKC